MKETLKQLGFVKRYDKDFREVEKPSDYTVLSLQATQDHSKLLEAYNNATTYVYAPMLSEFAKSQTIIDSIQTRWDNVIEYRHFITQEITEESLEPFEVVIYKDGIKDMAIVNMIFNLNHYKTIEQAINYGVLFLFKNEEL